MHILNEQTRKSLSRRTGKSYDEMLQKSAEELDALVEEHIGKKLTPAFSKKYGRSKENVMTIDRKTTCSKTSLYHLPSHLQKMCGTLSGVEDKENERLNYILSK